MRLLTHRDGGRPRAGFLLGDAVVDADAAAERARLSGGGELTVRGLLADPELLRRLGAAAAELAASGDERVRRLADVRLGPPVPDPEKIVCIGHNYAEHLRESRRAEDASAPVIFAKYRNSLIGSGALIRPPRASAMVDYEGELAFVIGAPCREVSVERALDHVAGYMPFNDVSARDLQRATTQHMLGKAIDTFGPCGPALVLADEVGDPQDLEIRTRVNGVTVQQESTGSMMRSVAELLSFLSHVMTLVPGDIVSTGSPAGVGAAQKPPRWLQEGDAIEIEIGDLGLLRNAVGPPLDAPPDEDARWA